MKHLLLSIILFCGSAMNAMDNNNNNGIDYSVNFELENTALLPSEKHLSCYDSCENFLDKNKKIAMAVGSGILTIGSNILLGSAYPVAAGVFSSGLTTSVKGILPKSTDNQALKLGTAVTVGLVAAGIDIGFGYLGLNTNGAFATCALICGLAAMKRVQKGHIKGDAKSKSKEDKKASKEKTVEIVIEK